MTDSPAYFARESGARFRPTALVGGAWSSDEQHIAPAIGLLAHAIERDRDARRGDDLRLTRLSCDILGVVAIEPVDVHVEVLRPGRTIELVEARLTAGARTIVVARAWLAQRADTAAIAGSPFPRLPEPSAMPVEDLATVWPGAFVGSLSARRQQAEPGRAVAWMSTPIPLLRDEPVSTTAAVLGLIDTTNGTSPRLPPDQVAFPNLDLTAHLFREPVAGPVGYDVSVSFGPDGAGLTQAVLHDAEGPFGTSAQTLTLRQR
ncbi:thioesterase family protein [Amnibacterium kyonggiense]|uniref:Thioesterase superfamily protein n=1 Tax=Amnibacterium kyonggiense TaxID=595671 RepID=A0A4R7FJ85_9MICO|nr:thioesterase family protein [Amnibacterium kyonggiense]TDS75836.1 thioesterase superfamily protein [Amnibacterium kyonggiense]